MKPLSTLNPILNAAQRTAGRSQSRSSNYSMTDEQADSKLAWLARQTGGAVEGLGKILDTPGAILRGALVGDAASGLSWDSEERVYGEDLLRRAGLIDDQTPYWLKTAGGLATEIALDPLAIFSGPLKAVTGAGKAARAAGLMDKAGDAILAAKGIDRLADASATGRAAMSFAKKNALPLTEETFKIRPLVGPRAARRSTTLDEVVKYVDDAAGDTKAREAVESYLTKQGMYYDEVASQTLTKDVGIGIMGFDPLVRFNLPGGGAMADRLDVLGQAAMWSRPMRGASAMFDKKVGGTYKVADQVDSIKHYNALKEAAKDARRAAARHAMTIADIPLDETAKGMLGADSLISEKGNDFLTRVFENTYTKEDKFLMDRIGPSLTKAVDSWKKNVDDIYKQGRGLGMDMSKFEDFQRGVKYTPRTAAEVVFDDAAASGGGRAVFNTKGTENRAREEYLKTVGGTVDLREISLLPEIDDFSRNPETTVTIEQAGEAIRKWHQTKHGPQNRFVPPPQDGPGYLLTKEQSEKIASFMKRLDPRREGGTPVFSEHPLTAQTRLIVSQAEKRANAEHLYKSIAEHAVNMERGATTGRTQTIKQAMQKIAAETGLKSGKNDQLLPTVELNIKNEIAKALGVAYDNIDLDKMTVSDDAVNRLLRINDYYAKPAAQAEISKFFDTITSLFKGFVLFWPSRFVRDFYSNAYSLFLETGDVAGTAVGMKAAANILSGEFYKAVPQLRAIPAYAHIVDDTALRQRFMEDLAASGVLSTLASSDLTTATRSGITNQLVPGMQRQTLGTALSELGQNWSKFNQFGNARDMKPFGIPLVKDAMETGNPLLRTQESLSNFIDSQARLGGYITLLKNGVTSDEASRRITESLVDYGSLTTMERTYFRNIFPWWAYNSRIGKYVVKSLMENPGGRYAQTIRGMNTIQRPNEDVYVPEALRQQFAIRAPSGSTEYETYYKDIDLPGIDVLSLFSPKPTAMGTLSATAQNIGQQLNPFLKTAAEQISGTDFFSRRPLNEAITPFDRMMKGLGVTKRDNEYGQLGRFIQLIPGTSRPINLAGGLLDERLTLPDRLQKQAINQLTGVKRQDVDKQWQLNDASRALQDRLEGWTRSKTITSVPKELIPLMPEGSQELAELQRIIASRYAKQSRETAKAKEAEKRTNQWRSGTAFDSGVSF